MSVWHRLTAAVEQSMGNYLAATAESGPLLALLSQWLLLLLLCVPLAAPIGCISSARDQYLDSIKQSGGSRHSVGKDVASPY